MRGEKEAREVNEGASSKIPVSKTARILKKVSGSKRKNGGPHVHYVFQIRGLGGALEKPKTN